METKTRRRLTSASSISLKEMVKKENEMPYELEQKYRLFNKAHKAQQRFLLRQIEEMAEETPNDEYIEVTKSLTTTLTSYIEEIRKDIKIRESRNDKANLEPVSDKEKKQKDLIKYLQSVNDAIRFKNWVQSYGEDYDSKKRLIEQLDEWLVWESEYADRIKVDIEK